MHQKKLLWIVVLAASTTAVISFIRVDIVSAQQAGEAGVGGAGGAGGGGGGGGGGRGGGSSNGALAAYGEYIYVLQHGSLFQYAAYDLTLVKKINLSETGQKNRIRRRQIVRQSDGGLDGGRGGDGGQGGGGGGGGGQGGAGGQGGGFGFSGGYFGRADAVAAYDEYVYVLQGKTLHKLAADSLDPVKKVTLDFDVKAGN